MAYIEGNQLAKTNVSANGQTLVLDVAGLSVVRFEFSGTYSFTSQFESSIDGTPWFPLQVAMVNAPTVVTSHSTANATQAYEASVHSDRLVRVRLSAFTSAGAHKVLIAGSSSKVEPTPVAQIAGTVPVTTTTPSGSAISVTTTASTNASIQKSTAGNLFEISVSNATATAAAAKFYNKTSAPTVGTDVPVLTIPIPAYTTTAYNFGALGKRFTSGIAMAITANTVASDTTAAVAGVQVHGTYV